MRTAALKVNQERLVQNLRFAFTNKSTVLSELMQNGRRAGATEINFDLCVGDLTVTDNGHGVDDMQNMLTIAESGWDQETRENEHPFGMGFLSAIFAAQHVKIESRGKKMEFDTDHALTFGEVDIVKSDFIGGTQITMSGFGMDLPQIKGALTRFAKGFPISVFLNGELFESPQSEQNLTELIDIPGVGKVVLGTCAQMAIYLQGLPVYLTSYSEANASIVHLESRLFYAKMPDRNVLIDEGDQLKKIGSAIQGEWRKRLVSTKQQVSAQEFVEKYWGIAKHFGILDVMNDVPIIPACALSIINQPTQLTHGDRLGTTNKAVTRAAVEAKEITLCQNSASDLEGDNLVTTVFAHKKEWLEVDKLPDGHWANSHVLNLDDIEPELQYEVKAKAYFGGQYVDADLIVCDEYRINVGGDAITVDDMAVVFGEDSSDCTILVPRNSDGTEALCQASSYADEWDAYNENAHEEDQGAISDQVQILRGEDPCVTMGKVLSEGNLSTCRNVLGGLFLVQARAGTSWGCSDYVIDASSIMDALKSAEFVLANTVGNDGGAMEKIQATIAQIKAMQQNAILDLADTVISREFGHSGHEKNSEMVRYVSARFEEEIARGNHTVLTVAGTLQSAIDAFNGDAS